MTMYMVPSHLLILRSILDNIETYFDMGLDFADYQLGNLCYQPHYFKARLSWNLETLLDLCQELNIKIDRCSTWDIYKDEDKATEAQLKVIKAKDGLLYKILTNKLTPQDLYQLADEKRETEYQNLAIFNLRVILNLAGVPKNAPEVLEGVIKSQMNRFLAETEIPGEYEQNLYTYRYQKANFLKNVKALYNQFGAKLELSNIEHYKIFGEDIDQIRFLETLLGLELEGYLKIINIRLHNVTPPTKNKQSKPGKFKKIQILITHVEVNPERIGIGPQENLVEEEQNHQFPPVGWILQADDNQAHIIHDKEIVFTFPTKWSRRYRFFEYLWNHYGQHAAYQDLYEYKSNLNYSEVKVPWKVNKGIRDELIKLKKKLSSKGLPINIEIEKGFKLTVENPNFPPKSAKNS